MSGQSSIRRKMGAEMNRAEGKAGIQKRLTVSSERNRALLKGQEAGCGNVLLHAVGGGRWRQPGLHSQLEATLGYMRPYLKRKRKKRRQYPNEDTRSGHTVREPPPPPPLLCQGSTRLFWKGPHSLQFTHNWAQAPTQTPSC